MTKKSAVVLGRYPTFLAPAGICIFLSFSNIVFGQTNKAIDSLQQFQEVVVQGYLSQQPLLLTPASIGIVNTAQLSHYSSQSLLSPLNQVPGVRMEERSPGSYRLSLRGSLLRSPFGVRNVKIYMDEFPLTDASGNTYLNLIDAKAIERVEVLKGPDGSLFGANSGGVVLMDLHGRKRDSSQISVDLTGGSFGSLHENTSLKYASGKSWFTFNQGFQRSDGYRQHSALQRHYLQAAECLRYGNNNSVKLLSFYSGLQYKTPGGLTQAQYEADPQQARPAAGPNPGAMEQQAGIENQTFFVGITNELYLLDRLRYVASVFGTHTDFENPFITNYEVRNEKNLGVRTYLELTDLDNSILNWKWSLGLEGQKGWQDISNYQNDGGTPALQFTQDALDIDQIFYFTRWAATLHKRLTTELAVSLNAYKYSYSGWTSEGKRKFEDQWMPRFAMSYLILPGFTLRATLSRGYSPPTLAEIRPSGNMINPDLQPESGWNREVGSRLSLWNGRIQADASVFRYDLTNAIVRRVDENDTEFFVNAGGTKQSGIETSLMAWLARPRKTGVIRALQISGSYTYSHFLFRDYRNATTDYSGKSLTGVPQTVMVFGIRVQLPQELSLFVESNFTSRLPLNDGNTEYADQYKLLQAKISWSKIRVKKVRIELYAGLDNILNEKYSLGNDINAFGGRYFNAAAPLNYYAGVHFNFR
jgi:iron complex outermembrane receptor protein